MDELVKKVWQKAIVTNNRNPDIWRKDFAGAWIRYDQYGINSRYGWVIDHIKPKKLGGEDSIENLQALHWRNNVLKGNNYDKIETCITSEDFDNVFKIKKWKLNTSR